MEIKREKKKPLVVVDRIDLVWTNDNLNNLSAGKIMAIRKMLWSNYNL